MGGSGPWELGLLVLICSGMVGLVAAVVVAGLFMFRPGRRAVDRAWAVGAQPTRGIRATTNRAGTGSSTH